MMPGGEAFRIASPTPVGIGDVVGHFEYQIANSTDPYVQLLSRRVTELAHNDDHELGDRILGTIALSINKHPAALAADHCRIFERSLAASQIHQGKHDFVAHIAKPKDWDEPLRDAFFGPISESWTFNAFIGMNVLTNIPERGKFVKLEAILDELPQPLKLVEVGASQMHIGRKLALHGIRKPLAFRPIEIVKPQTTLNTGRDRYKRLPEDSQLFSKLVQRGRYEQGSYVGIDELDPRTKLVTAKVEGDSFYLSERVAAADSARRKEFKILKNMASLPDQHYHYADCAKPIDIEDFFRNNPAMKHGADIVLGSFVAYEVREQYATLIENMRQLANPKTGRLMVIDHMRIKPDGTPLFSATQSSYEATVTVFDNAKPELGWQTRYTLETGRGHRFLNETSVGNLALSRQLGIRPSRQAT